MNELFIDYARVFLRQALMIYFLFVVWIFPPVYCTQQAMGTLILPESTCLPICVLDIIYIDHTYLFNYQIRPSVC